MKLFLLGATGNSGRRILTQALQRGHEVTVCVRDPAKLSATPDNSPGKATVIAGYTQDITTMSQAMRGHDVVINAAGTTASPTGYTTLVSSVIKAAEESLGEHGRFWLFGGAAALDVPGTSSMTLDLPLIPKAFQLHRTNLEVVRKTRLDWSMLCPGPMIDSPNGRVTAGLRISTEHWPVDGPALAGLLPGIAKSVAFVRHVPEMTIYYEDAASVILDHLAAHGQLSRKRVGVALPRGVWRHKS
jgi:uncharacterized protein